MGWEYRVVRRTVGNEKFGFETEFGIHEHFTDPSGWTEEPVAPIADSVEELRDVLTRMLEALDKGVIDGSSTPQG